MMNLIVAGIGGQGINVLTRILAEVVRASGLECQYTVHKGGAQSLGAVFGEMRMVRGELPVLGAGIPMGKLDILVALDPWEALRHLPRAHAGTRVWAETEIQPLFNERAPAARERARPLNPVAQLNKLPLQINWRNYRRDAAARFGDAKMANYLAGLDSLAALGIADASAFERVFFATIAQARPARAAHA